MLKNDPDVASWSTYVGRGAIRFYLPLDVQLANDFFSQIVVIAKDVAARDRLHAKLEKEIAEQLPSVVARVSPLELGPPVGWPVQYRVSGPDLAQVRVDRLAARSDHGRGRRTQAASTSTGWSPPVKVRIEIDQDQARLLGLELAGAAEVLNTVMTGTPMTQVRDDIYLVDVVARAQDEQRVSLSTLRGAAAAAAERAHRAAEPGRELRFRSGIPADLAARPHADPDVQADVPGAATPEAAVDALAPAIESCDEAAEGLHIAVGGTVEESAASQASVFAKVPPMLFLMLLFLMAQLHSFSRLALVLSLVPMGLIGIVGALLLAGRPLGFVAILGILALMGMIARNAVILIEQIETERREGRGAWDAVVEGSVSRFRPIMLTAISTVLGFIPIAPTVFWGPMAFAIMGGLFVATVLTLLVLPALYVIFFRSGRNARGPGWRQLPRPGGRVDDCLWERRPE